jgi:PKD repeat protein
MHKSSLLVSGFVAAAITALPGLRAAAEQAPRPKSLPPTCTIEYSPTVPQIGQTVTFDAMVADPDGWVVFWAWDFGDGSADFGEVVTHSYESGGTYTVALTVTDDWGDSGSCQTTVQVGATVQVEIPLSQGWHMISLPLEPVNKTILVDRETGVEDPGSILCAVWQQGNDPRSRLFRMEPSIGYWVYNPDLYPTESWYEIGIKPPPGKPHPGPWWQGFWLLVEPVEGVTISYTAHAMPTDPMARALDINENQAPGTFDWGWMLIGACARVPNPYTSDVTIWPPTSMAVDLMWGSASPGPPTVWLPTADCSGPDAWTQRYIGLPLVGSTAGVGYYAASPPPGEPCCGAPADTDNLTPGHGYWIDIENPNVWLRLFGDDQTRRPSMPQPR